MSDEGLDIRGPWDLVVVGHGFAGLSAAVAFLESWPGTAPRVAVIHRGVPGERGGSTGESSAIFRLTDTGDLPEGVAERIGASAGAAVDEGYLQDFAAQLPATLAWLQSNGVEHQPAKGIVVPGSTGDWNLIVGGGAHFIETYAQRGINFGARFFAQVELVGLEREPAGRVTGARVRSADGEAVMKATVVVLACGGFEGDLDEIARRIPGGELLEPACSGARQNTGAGIAAAVAIGAARCGQRDGAYLVPVDPRSDLPAPVIGTWMWGILVDLDGRRFVDEAEHGFELHASSVARAVLSRGGLAFAITDASVRAATPMLGNFQRTDQPAIVADSIQELADRLGMNSAVLRRTVAEYNAAPIDIPYDGSRLDGRRTVGIVPVKSNWALALTEPPFEALPVAARIAFTFDGLRVDHTTHVLDEGGQPIPGLYAAGEIVGLSHGDTYLAGTSSLRALVIGRRAGQVAASEILP